MKKQPTLLTWREVGQLIRKRSFNGVQAFIAAHKIKKRKVSSKVVLYVESDIFKALNGL